MPTSCVKTGGNNPHRVTPMIVLAGTAHFVILGGNYSSPGLFAAHTPSLFKGELLVPRFAAHAPSLVLAGTTRP